MKITFSLFVLLIFIFSCDQKENNTGTVTKKITKAWLDSIINNSDSSYVKPYYRKDFVTALYYVNKKDSSICQLMKDSTETIRQILIVRKNTRTYFAQYYSNGQLKANLPLDEYGQYHGASISYYANGKIQSSGNYMHGLKSGSWKIFNTTGHLVSTEKYDTNGQLIK